jgi:hypothetical protein
MVQNVIATIRSKGFTRELLSWRSLQLIGLAILVLVVPVLFFVVDANATAPTNGSIVPGAAEPVAPFTAGTPFASGQGIDIVVPANSVLQPNLGLNIVECTLQPITVTDPLGLPTDTSQCDGDTNQPNTIIPNADGSVDYQAETEGLYPVYATPDPLIGDTSSTPPCGDTPATECILYIGENDNDFTQPHVWSQPFFVAANATDSGTPAGDGSAPPAATAPSPTLSTVTASPTTITADGTDVSTVTVTLLGTGSLPVPGKSVTLAASPSTGVVVGAPATTDPNGVATFTISGSKTAAPSVTFTATDTTDSIQINQTATITFQQPVVNDAHSTVQASAPTVDLNTPVTITVTLRDQTTNAQPVAGQTVSLQGSAGGSEVITPATMATNGSGVATFSVVDATAEQVTFTATDTSTTPPMALSDTVAVTFGTLDVSASQSTVTVPSPAIAPLSPNGSATVTVTLLSSGGDPVSGKDVSLAASSTTAAISGSPSLTDNNGKVTFTVTDTVAESVTVTATDITDTLPITQTATVAFQTPVPSATASQISAGATTAIADGQTQTQITVVITDQFGDPLSGKTVQVQGTPSGNVLVHPISDGGASPGITNSQGGAQFEANDTAAESVTFTATDTTDNVVLTGNVTINYTAGPADPNASTSVVAASPVNPPADGTTPTTLTVTMTDEFGNPVKGVTVKVTALNGNSSITPASGMTGTDGTANFTATDATAEVVTYQATDVTDSNTVLTTEAVVTFGNPPAPPPVPSFSSVVVTPSTVPADGVSTSTISVLLYDGNGDAVPGKTVTLVPSGGSSKMTTVQGTSTTSGSALFTVTDTTAESVTYTAEDTTDSLNLANMAVTVQFTSAGTTTSTSTTTTTGSSTTTTTTTAAGGATTTTTGASPTTTTSSPDAATAAASDDSGDTGSGSSSGGSGSSLAFTGVSSLVPWLAGVGFVFIGIGSLGRRRAKAVAS